MLYGLANALSGTASMDVNPTNFLLLCVLMLIVTFPIVLSAALIGGLRSEKVETKSYPNQGIWLSIKNTLIITLGFGTIVLLVQLLLLLLFPFYSVDLLFIVLYFALWGGGIAVIRHYALRFMLWRKRNMPWDYTRFLDYAADRIFLRKVGGGYIFIHRLMMEHFANLGKTKENT
jgi:hypothetical protein